MSIAGMLRTASAARRYLAQSTPYAFQSLISPTYCPSETVWVRPLVTVITEAPMLDILLRWFSQVG
jgi:hypothetical protein